MVRYQLIITVDPSHCSVDELDDSVTLGNGIHASEVDHRTGQVRVYGDGMAGLGSLQALAAGVKARGWARSTELIRLGVVND